MTLAELNSLLVNNLTRVGANRITGPEILQACQAIVSYFATQISDIIPDWEDDLTFQTDGSDAGKYCTYPDTTGKKRIFETKTDDNINEPPPSNPTTPENTHWREISASSSSAIKEWAAGLFGPELIIVYHNHSTLGRCLFILLEASRPFNSTNIETELTEGKWALIGGADTGGSGPAIAEKYSNIAAMLADQGDQEEDELYFVLDASADTTVDAGWALYMKLATTTGALSNYEKLSEEESLDVIITSTPDWSDTVAGKVERAVQSEAETAADTTLGNRDNTRGLTARSFRWAFDAVWTWIKTQAQTVAAIWTFTGLKVSGQIESGKKVMLLIDTDGTLTKIPWAEVNTTNRTITKTGINNLMTTVLEEWKNSDGTMIMQILNGLRVKFGGTSAIWEIEDAVASDNAVIKSNDNQAKSLKFTNKNGDEFIILRTTTGSLAVVFRQVVEYDFSQGFKKVHVQSFFITDNTAAAWNNIYAIALAADQSVTINVNHLHAYATDRSVAFAYGNMQGYARRDNSNVTDGTNPAFTINGDGITGVNWRIIANNTTEAVNIDFQNNSGTGKTWHVALDLTYILRALPV